MFGSAHLTRFSLVAGAAAMMGALAVTATLPAAAFAAPIAPKPVLEQATSRTDLVTVGHRHYKKKRRSARHYDRSRRYGYRSHGYRSHGDVVVDAPFAHVHRNYGGVHVRAPFVDLYVPYR
ncbi:MAG: hypothetical protein NW205_07420 [Hyphomicrobiaceae bacterium]|nr:hypothetical protein [Hyphomicrobiaceae bacterium]